MNLYQTWQEASKRGILEPATMSFAEFRAWATIHGYTAISCDELLQLKQPDGKKPQKKPKKEAEGDNGQNPEA